MQTIGELKRLQSQPLSIKVKMTEQRIMQWVTRYGEDGVYLSFSGGKDSTVLVHIARKIYPKLPCVFVDVPTQFPELKSFAQNFDNIEIVKPKISFAQVCDKYGFPMISKEVSENVSVARKYLSDILNNSDLDIHDLTCIEENQEFADYLNRKMVEKSGGQNQRLAIMLGMLTRDKSHPIKANVSGEERSKYTLTKYRFLMKADFEISNRCCAIMKKDPAHLYSKQTGRVPITAQMAEESRMRQNKWVAHGCNGFDMKYPMSNPMAFWTENDVLEYIVKNDIEICSVYGDIVEDYGHGVEGQMSFADFGISEKKCKYKCTGCRRTGCMLCGFGAHLEHEEDSRFVKLKQTHPKMYALLDIVKNNGVTFRQAIEWTNKHLKRKIIL